jgi:hypothetical protein
MTIASNTLLRMFAINDQAAPPLRTRLIEPVTVADGRGVDKQATRMAQWLQHVYLLGAQEEPINFDLMFIDIMFDKDPWAPQYGDGTVNPLGLLHALTFASRQDPFGPPFVWGYHSGNPDSVKKDPIAIIAFSLLSALEQRVDSNVLGSPWRWNDVGLHKTPGYAIQHFSNAIECLPKGGPEVIFEDMMRRYREKLHLYVLEERVIVAQDGLEAALRCAKSGTEADRKQLAEACLTMSGRLGPRRGRKILLQSLFADELVDPRDVWPCGKPLKSVLSFLVALKEAGLVETREFWVGQVDKIMERIEAGQSTVLNGIRPVGMKRRIGALAIICWWLSAKAEEQKSVEEHRQVTPFNTEHLLLDFGYSGAHRDPVQACLKTFEFEKLAPFFEFLETTEEPLHSPFYEVGRFWWKNRCHACDEKRPLWLR